MVSYFYKYKDGMSDITRDKVFNSMIVPLLPERRKQSNDRVSKTIGLTFNNIKGIIDNKNKSDIDLLIYQLLNTGRRLREIAIPEVEMKDDGLYIQLSKGGGLFKTFLLDGDSKQTFKSINELRGKFTNNSISTQISRKLKYMNITAHRLRDIYVMLIQKFHNPEGLIIDDIANRYLGHKSHGSDRFYTRMIYTGGNPFDISLSKMKVKELKVKAKEMGLKRYSKLKKADLIKLIEGQ